MSSHELGGDPPCWAHLIDDDDSEAHLVPHGPMVVDLGIEAVGSGGAIWSLPHGGDLDANLIRLDAGSGVGEHVNNDVDVLIFVRSGSGDVTIQGETSELGPDHLGWIPCGTSRSINAGPAGITYLSVHRRRGSLAITKPNEPESTQ